MIRSMLLCCMMTGLLCSCGLSKYGIKEAWVFTEEKFRGTIQVDDNGNPITKGVMVETTIVFETKTQELPSWATAIIDGKEYAIRETAPVASPYTIGKRREDETAVIITATNGNHLYRLSLEAFDPSDHPDPINNIKLTSQSSEGPISIRIKKEAVALLPQMVP